ncbi:MAG: CBS domain-containing protein [Candidatus Methylomirabilales bacterium]
MDIERFMTANPITVRPDESLRKASELLQSHRIRHLPVVQRKRLVGVISDRDLRQLLPSFLAAPDEVERLRARGAHVKVGEVMTRQVLAVTPETQAAKAARLMVEHRIGCLPVLRGSTLVGIVTTVDLLRAMAGENQVPVARPEKASAQRRRPREDRRTPRAESGPGRR